MGSEIKNKVGAKYFTLILNVANVGVHFLFHFRCVYFKWERGQKKCMICTLVKMLTIMDGP